ncbi:hypothetical protein BC829DRAFT_435277 [Chytridium lagenaria]|nr:hypothetical protein BC829DRAFT_435277 [Chytridium lagenaria]
MSANFCYKAGAILGASGVAFGAFGSHALRGMMANVPDGARRVENWLTASQYQMAHALLLIAFSNRLMIRNHRPKTLATVSGYLITGGVVLFSGSIYLLALDTRKHYSKFFGTGDAFGWVVVRCRMVGVVVGVINSF